MDCNRLHRVALYARYSSDAQREASIEDQLRVCRARAEREGWHVTGAFTDAAIAEGARGTAVHQRLTDLETRRAELQSMLRNPPAPLPALHPNLAEIYRAKVATLQQNLASGDNPEALEAARALIDRVIVSPPPGDGEPPCSRTSRRTGGLPMPWSIERQLSCGKRTGGSCSRCVRKFSKEGSRGQSPWHFFNPRSAAPPAHVRRPRLPAAPRPAALRRVVPPSSAGRRW